MANSNRRDLTNSFPVIPTGNRLIDDLQNTISRHDKKQSVTSFGKTFRGVDITATGAVIPHRLGRPYKGFQVISKSATADIWLDTSVSVDQSKFIALKSSASVTVDLVIL